MKHFIDIQRLRKEDVDIGDGLIRPKNTNGFKVGDIVQVSEKIDGANASVCYDSENDKVVCFSSKQQIELPNMFRGFWPFVQQLDITPFKENPNYIVFGEWEVKHTIIYDKDTYEKWYVYDIYDKDAEQWLPQSVVKKFCEDNNLRYIHVLYEGAFESWEKIEALIEEPSAYGDMMEGVVIKNQSRLGTDDRNPVYIKIVRADFREVQRGNHRKKMEDLQRLEEKQKAQELMESIVTLPRVRKEIHKMVDEGLLGETITPKDMGIIAKNLPKRIFDDCIKEERDTVLAAGEYAGKICSIITMNLARGIILE